MEDFMKSKLTLTLLAVILVPALAAAYSGGPPNGRTGAPRRDGAIWRRR